MLQKLQQSGIPVIMSAIREIVVGENGLFQGAVLENGEAVQAERAFLAFGGNEIRTELAAQLGVERMENKHIPAHPRTKMTNVPNVWAAGDVGVHSELLTVAMGEGALAAVWIHKAILKMGAEDDRL